MWDLISCMIWHGKRRRVGHDMIQIVGVVMIGLRGYDVIDMVLNSKNVKSVIEMKGS